MEYDSIEDRGVTRGSMIQYILIVMDYDTCYSKGIIIAG